RRRHHAEPTRRRGTGRQHSARSRRPRSAVNPWPQGSRAFHPVPMADHGGSNARDSRERGPRRGRSRPLTDNRRRRTRAYVWLLIAVAAAAAIAVRTALQRPLPLTGSAPDDGYARVSGVIHVHTTLSDGSGSPSDVIAAAQAAGLGFVVITDHNT